MAKIKAYTLLEILVVIAILSTVALVVIPLSLDQIGKSRAETAAKVLYLDLILQQQKSFSQTNNSKYGIEFGTNSYKVFAISATDNSETSTITTLENGTQLNPISLQNSSNRIEFPQGSVRPNTYGTIKVTYEGLNYIVDINAEGLLNYYNQ
jgi:prepilin-type N-terminal cleavage/methylation domain-containing protein